MGTHKSFWAVAIAAVTVTGAVTGCIGQPSTTAPVASVHGDSPSPDPSFPAIAWPSDWPTAAPETEGLDSATLANGLRQLADNDSRIHSLLIARHGTVVLDAYAYPYDGSTYHDLASVTKSVTTTLIGIAADQGLLDLDAPMLSFFLERAIANRTERKERITVRQLASMTSGLDCVVDRSEVTLNRMVASDDWVGFALDLETVAEPGERFSYCSPGMHLLSAILTQATGQSALEFARANLFEPLGIPDAYWPADATGISHGWGGLGLHPHDAAKLGQLFLQHGRWEGAQIVSSAWVTAATSAQAATGGFKAEDYGYGWWIARPRTEPIAFFRADGNGGQRILGIPELGLLIVTTGGGFALEEATPFILAAATDNWQPLPRNPGGVEQLAGAVALLGAAPAPESLPALPAAAAALSGRSIEFETNDYAIRSLRVDFAVGAAEAIVIFNAMHESPVREMVVGLDGRWRMSRAGRPIAARGEWLDEATFAIEVDEGPGIAQYTLRLAVDGASARLEAPGLSLTGRIGG